MSMSKLNFVFGMNDKALFRAVQKSSDWAELRKTLKHYPAIHNVKDADGKTILHVAAETGNINVVTLLLSNKRIDVNALDASKWTPLHCAANAGHFEICILLLTKAKNINVNIKNEDENGVLVYLARLSNQVVTDQTLKPYLQVLKLMVQQGVDVTAKNVFGDTPLHFACNRGTIYSVQFLLKHGAKVNQENSKKETALHWAMRRPVFEIIKLLAENGGDPYLASSNGATPMGLALERNHKEIASIMNSRALFCKEAMREHANAGNLERQYKSKWEKVYCVLKETLLFVYESNDPVRLCLATSSDSYSFIVQDEKPISSYDVCEFSIIEDVPDKMKHGRQFVFMLEGELRCSIFAVSTDLERFGWLKSMSSARQIKAHMLSQQETDLSTEAKTGSSTGKKKDPKKNLQSKECIMESEEINGNLIRALEDVGNCFCADCNRREPYWMLVEYGALVCFECAKIHSRLRTSAVKSVHYDCWLFADSMKLKCNGNINHNTKLEAHIANKPNATSSVEEKERFIQEKYNNKEPSKPTQKLDRSDVFRATVNRIAKYKSIYFKTQLLQSLSIPTSMWTVLKSSSVYGKIATAMEQNEEFDHLFIESLSTTLDPVSGYANRLLKQMIPFVRLLIQWKSKECIEKAEILLLEILESYSELQGEIFDIHVQKIFKWWVPQAAEILALCQGVLSKELTKTIELQFCKNSVKALFLLTGEYLIFESDAWPKSADDGDRGAQVKAIQEKCQAHTETLRKLLATAFKYQKNKNQSDESFSHASEDPRSKSVARMNSLDLKRTLSYTWSHTSTGDQSPRDNTESFLAEDSPAEYPLVTFLHQMPFSVANMLCSLVARIPEDLQKDLLGLVSTGHSFIEIQAKHIDEDVFSSSQPTMESVLIAIHRHTETLRRMWPSSCGELDPSTTDKILRQVFIMKRHLRLLYGFSVPWTLPEVWNCWRNLQNISSDVVEFLIFSAKSGSDCFEVSKVLCVLLVQVRWTINKLKEIQRVDICAI